MVRSTWHLSKKVRFKKEEGELSLDETRFILLSARMLPRIHKQALRMVGPVVNSIIYETCFEESLKYFESAVKNFPKDLSKEEKERSFLTSFKQFGLGKAEIKRGKKTKIRVYSGCYAPFYGTRKEPVCYITAGILAGLFSAIKGEKVSVREMKCVAMGDKFCEFEVSGY